ncbi:inhibitor of KinA [Paenibacillus eucommiae]|uniref:Inhibitor of KinA n=1 Tax=Paenibacillus eucommiae TaxID=1355755 RepID=A0ABS4IML3_9BACL|nr:inhibitor of KinA [Paenibacillus eucommiae]
MAEHPFEGLIELVPAFTSVTVYYDPMRIHLVYNRSMQAERSRYPFEIVEELLKNSLELMNDYAVPEPQVVQIPVCYDEEFGVDLAHVAKYNGLSKDEVIAIHTSGEYLVHMLGFAPGFPYLGGMDKRIAAPRRQTPRLSVPPGTVGIAGEQTGVYSVETPGGWQLIGRTPLTLFVPGEQPPTLLEAGNVIRFYPISREEYGYMKGLGI